MEEHEALKAYLHDVVKQSGLDVTLHFPQNPSFESSGCYVPGKRTIMLSMNQCNHEVKYHDIASRFSLQDYTEMVLAHELGHAYDDIIFKKEDTVNHHLNQALRAEMTGHKKVMKRHFRMFTHEILEFEKRAWEHAPRFLLSSLNQVDFDAYRDFSLQSYRDSYASRYRSLLSTIRFLQTFQHHIDATFVPIFDFSFDCGETLYDQEKHAMKVYIDSLRRASKEASGLKPIHYMMCRALYLICTDNPYEVNAERFYRHFANYFNRTKTFDETCAALKETYREVRSEMWADFSMMEEAFSVPLSSFEQYKTHMENQLEKDERDSLASFERLERRRQKQKKEAIL